MYRLSSSVVVIAVLCGVALALPSWLQGGLPAFRNSAGLGSLPFGAQTWDLPRNFDARQYHINPIDNRDHVKVNSGFQRTTSGGIEQVIAVASPDGVGHDVQVRALSDTEFSIVGSSPRKNHFHGIRFPGHPAATSLRESINTKVDVYGTLSPNQAMKLRANRLIPDMEKATFEVVRGGREDARLLPLAGWPRPDVVRITVPWKQLPNLERDASGANTYHLYSLQQQQQQAARRAQLEQQQQQQAARRAQLEHQQQQAARRAQLEHQQRRFVEWKKQQQAQQGEQQPAAEHPEAAIQSHTLSHTTPAAASFAPAHAEQVAAGARGSSGASSDPEVIVAEDDEEDDGEREPQEEQEVDAAAGYMYRGEFVSY